MLLNPDLINRDDRLGQRMHPMNLIDFCFSSTIAESGFDPWKIES